ncbi:MAG: aminodeoxychorismate lyase [Gammaproteobacteria bacterium]|nr:aminodeoxychorismate lyase [Gammaproteobacteria bacterium]
MLINGVEANAISSLDRGLHYGDGLFETIAVKNGKLQLWHQHMQRFLEGCERLSLPAIDPELLHAEAARLLSDDANNSQAILKIILTRGVGGRGYHSPETPSVTRILLHYPWPSFSDSYWQEGVHVELCKTGLGSNPVLAGIKHLNRLEQVMASREWCEPEVQEGLMLDQQGNVIEGTRTNLFVVKNNQLITPDLSMCGVEGVMRGAIINIAKKSGLQVHVAAVSQEVLKKADELFLCNSIIGIWPVKSAGQIIYSKFFLTKKLMVSLEQQLAHSGIDL